MKKTKRLLTLFSELEFCERFADVGCDHGYCAEYMLKNGLCKTAVISDISAASLDKARRLLQEYEARGKLVSVCCNGLERVPAACDFVLIAGMGGEEILSILQKGFRPAKLLLQPMKNTRKVREYLLAQNYAITRDYTFADGKFYDLIKAVRGASVSAYSAAELTYGRTNLQSPGQDFLRKLESEISKKKNYPQSEMSGERREQLARELAELEEVYFASQRNLQNTQRGDSRTTE